MAYSFVFSTRKLNENVKPYLKKNMANLETLIGNCYVSKYSKVDKINKISLKAN